MTKDRTTGLIALVAGCLVAFATSQLPASDMAGDIGPRVFPYICAALLVLCGAGLLLTSAPKNPDEQPFYTKEQLKRLFLIFGVVLVYCILIQYIGYPVATLAGCFVLSLMFGRREHIAWWKSLVFAAIMTVVLYYAFVKLFSIQLPKGILF